MIKVSDDISLNNKASGTSKCKDLEEGNNKDLIERT